MMHPLDDPKFNTNGWYWEHTTTPLSEWTLHLPPDAKINARLGETSDFTIALRGLLDRDYRVTSGTLNADGTDGPHLFPNEGGHVIFSIHGPVSNQAFSIRRPPEDVARDILIRAKYHAYGTPTKLVLDYGLLNRMPPEGGTPKEWLIDALKMLRVPTNEIVETEGSSLIQVDTATLEGALDFLQPPTGKTR